ncbi:XdhC family protein [Paenibacillus harenae]|uniref:XdhC family protein n=1 Tax=Paenibacillus harenae TaxID=306543 RepID=UPI0004084943|nr:XdhC family protein [Paenibacillus harenae]
MDMHEVLAAVNADDQPCVLATIVGVDGHSYRKTGAVMLIKLSGGQVGAISPGCLEQDVIERAPEVWNSGSYSLIDYNMDPDEDVIWGEAVGCGGKIKLLLEPVIGVLRSLLLEAAKRTASGESIWLERNWSGGTMAYSLAADECYAGELPEAAAAREASGTILAVKLQPKPRLVLFGAGRDAGAISPLAKQVGFLVVVADWRPELCSRKLYPEAECFLGSPGQIAENLGLCSKDYLIVCSHHLQQDKEMIRLALPLQLAYIGVLGSKKRIRMLFETFLIPSNVRAPIGLPIGADGPYEIAVSIAAELVSVRAGLQAKPLGKAVRDGDFGSVSGGWTERKDGNAQAVAAAVDRQAARQLGAARPIVQPSCGNSDSCASG